MDFLSELEQKRKHVGIGYTPYNYLETYGATLVEILAFEPDPLTYRNDYYYNGAENVLYKRTITKRINGTPMVGYWKSVST